MTKNFDIHEADLALDAIRPALDADGFILRIAEVDEATMSVLVGLDAAPDACFDCLVPDDTLRMIVQDAIRLHLGAAVEVAIERTF